MEKLYTVHSFKNCRSAYYKGICKGIRPENPGYSIAPGTVTINPEWNDGPEDELSKHIPLQRIGEPTDIMEAIMFLTRSNYVTGQVITVDGGRILH